VDHLRGGMASGGIARRRDRVTKALFFLRR
jgi:hypothetical protein